MSPRERMYDRLRRLRADPRRSGSKPEHVYIPRKTYDAFKRDLSTELMVSDMAYADSRGLHAVDGVMFAGAYIWPLDGEDNEDA